MTFDQLCALVKERQKWLEDRPNDPLASEWRLVVSLGEELIESRERFGAVANTGFLR